MSSARQTLIIRRVEVDEGLPGAVSADNVVVNPDVLLAISFALPSAFLLPLLSKHMRRD